jgi:small GTP-binding protein
LEDETNSFKETYNVQSIFDFGGQKRFGALIPKFLGGANGVLLVFDLTRRNSFEQLDFWYDQVLEHAKGVNLPKLLVGSKSDLISSTPIENLVPEKEILKFVREKNIDGFFKTSALQNQNVLNVFKELNNLMLKHQNTRYVVC